MPTVKGEQVGKPQRVPRFNYASGARRIVRPAARHCEIFAARPHAAALVRPFTREALMSESLVTIRRHALSLAIAIAVVAARGASAAAFDERCIPPGGVAPRSNTGGILARRALPDGRIARLGATRHLHHGLLARGGPATAQSIHEAPANAPSIGRVAPTGRARPAAHVSGVVVAADGAPVAAHRFTSTRLTTRATTASSRRATAATRG